MRTHLLLALAVVTLMASTAQASVAPPRQVPEPASLVLIGSGLAAT